MRGTSLIITYFLVFASDLCRCQQHISLELGKESQQYTTQCLQYTYFKVDATEPCRDLHIQVKKVAGEPNLYVSSGRNKYPTTKNLAWSAYNWGGESLTISSWEPDYIRGTFYLGVHAYCGDDVTTGNTPATYTVEVNHVTPTHPRYPDDLLNRKNSSTLPAGGYQYYRFCIPQLCSRVEVTLEHCMSPSAPGCNGKYGFPELIVSKSLERPTERDRAWILAELRRTITLLPNDTDFDPGHYYVGVYGWCTPTDQCPDRDTCGPCDLADQLAYSVSVTATALSNDVCSQMLVNRPVDPCDTSGQTYHGGTALLIGALFLLLSTM